LTFENNQQVFTDMFMWSPGTEIKVVLERDGKEFVIEKALTQSFTPGQKLQPNPSASEKQVVVRKVWLKG